MSVIGEASNGDSALELCHELQPDVIVLDISMPFISGFELTQKLREHCPHSRILALTMHESVAYLRRMLEAGASGYLVKRSSGEDVLHGIRSVARGGTYIDPKLAESLASGLRAKNKEQQSSFAASLSEREVAVLRMVAEGHSSKEIALVLNIGKKSVDTYRLRAMQKLGFESRSEIVRYAMGQSWLS
jgi:DNA-binding NarL/FixJ family response regulator